MRLGNPAALAATLFALSATSAFAASHTILVGQSGSETFTPSSITIPSGDTITFMDANTGGLMHNAVSDDNGTAFNSGDPIGGQWTFTTGPITTSVAYHCTLHGSAGPGGGTPGSGMAGSITVQPTPVVLQSFEVD